MEMQKVVVIAGMCEMKDNREGVEEWISDGAIERSEWKIKMKRGKGVPPWHTRASVLKIQETSGTARSGW